MEEIAVEKIEIIDEKKDEGLLDECGESSSASNCLVSSVTEDHCSSDASADASPELDTPKFESKNSGM